MKVMTSVHAEGRAKLGIRPGDTVRVVQKIVELKRGKGTDKKEKINKIARTQTFEGLVLSVKHGTEAGATFTVRATLSGVGVEKTFPLYSPAIDKIEIVRRSKVRRAKLYFIREKAAKEVKRQLRNARRVSIVEEAAPEMSAETKAAGANAGSASAAEAPASEEAVAA
jgi:large subunit ribosomal protein L19